MDSNESEMPPVRWKHCIITMAFCMVQSISPVTTDAQPVQDSISMTLDGWRPIVGSGRKPAISEEITHYKNPSLKHEVLKKAEVPEPTTSPLTPPPHPSSTGHTGFSPSPQNNNSGNQHLQYKKTVAKNSQTQGSKHTPVNYQTGGSHGPHIPIGPAAHLQRPLQHGPVKKYPAVHNGGKRIKPMRGQAVAHSTRDEVYAQAPTGTFSYNPQGQNIIKTRETLLGSNHFPINQPNSHMEFTNRFPLPPHHPVVFQQFQGNPLQNFIYKNPQTNEVHYTFKNQNDEYTRNLVPPPQPQYTKEIIKNKAHKVKATTEPTNQIPQYLRHEGFQVPPPFEQIKYADKNQGVEVEISKQKLKVFHNSIPSNYNPLAPDYIDYDFHSIKRPTDLPKVPTYEVTEGKPWQETPQVPQVSFHYRFPEAQPHIPHRHKKPTTTRRPSAPIDLNRPIIELNLPPFLPTPYKPEGVVPTSPTQEDVSTIFNELSTKVKTHVYPPQNAYFFDVKEVSTHYPILGRPEVVPEIQTELNKYQEPEISNEITTRRAPLAEIQINEDTTLPPTTTTEATPQRTRATHRRRRPVNRTRTTTTTTTEEPTKTEIYEPQKTQENETEASTETEKPIRRKPVRYRMSTTESAVIEEPTSKSTRGRNRYRQRPTTYESLRTGSSRIKLRPSDIPSNHKETKIDVDSNENKPSTEDMSYEPNYPTSTGETQGLYESQYQESAQIQSTEEDMQMNPNRHEYELNRYTSDHDTTVANNDLVIQQQKPAEVEETIAPTEESVKLHTTEVLPTTNIHIPENEIDYSTATPIATPATTEEIEQQHATLATTIATTTTEEPTTKSHRIRGRPIKYDSSNRPRFSVKEYRQRLNQYTSTSTTTESYPRSTSESLRIRFPNRNRKPFISSTTLPSITVEEDSTEPIRNKFKPKDPRHGGSSDSNDNIIVQKDIKSVNTRLRPFGRFRSTTEATTPSPKISIKPNLFANRRRPPLLSLKARIQQKLNKTLETTTVLPDLENETEQISQTTVSYELSTPESTTEHPYKKMKTTTEFLEPEITTDTPETTTLDILKNESILYSQRVSDLTSSFKNQYDTPGLFKNVSPTSRRIPNYFTISTDNPILPIEAFFPNIKERSDRV